MATVELAAENFESTVTGGGLVLYAQPGALPQQLIAKVREIDTDDVRKSLVQTAAS